MVASKSSGSSQSSERWVAAAVIGLLAAIGFVAAYWSWTHGYTLYDGDAEAHLNIARRLLDSRTPGPEQIGTGWLPLPHLLMAPFAMKDAWWKSGLAGVIPSSICFIVAGAFLFAAARRAYSSAAAGVGAALLFALNPNVLYLQSVPMTEMLFLATLAALLWGTLWFRDSQSLGALLFVAAASCLASLTRYEGWFLIPFVAGYMGLAARQKWHAVMFAGLAALAPLAWLAHNQYYFSNALEFYNGPWSAMAIHQRQVAQGVVHPTDHSWRVSANFYFEAVRLAAGTPAMVVAGAGVAMAVWQRVWWPIVLLFSCPVFYVWSLHSGGADLYVPTFWPFTAYNTRYAAAAILLLSFAGAALVSAIAPKARGLAVAVLIAAVSVPWALSKGTTSICWQEAAANSVSRRAAQSDAAVFLAANYRSGEGILFSFGELSGVLREAGIPFREGLFDGNHPAWDAAVAKPVPFLFLNAQWVLKIAGGEIEHPAANPEIRRYYEYEPVYRLRKRVLRKDAPAIEIYHLE